MLPRPRVAANRRTLELPDGTPFFWLADTAWEIFHRLDREDAARYLENRAEKGFNVIQAVCLAEEDGLRVPNRYGHLPLVDEDPTRLHAPYWDHIDWCVAKAASLGMYTAMLPTWGDKVNESQWGKGPIVFDEANARRYGRLVAERYRNVDSVIWVNGGDRNPGDKAAVWEALAQGLLEGDGGKARLMTFHPDGGRSSGEYFHNAEWLDFNMMQSGHGSPTGHPDRMLELDYKREPTKPVLDGEPRYENHPSFEDGSYPYYDEHDVRRAVYQSVFAGGCGVTYGCHAIWQMYGPGDAPVNGPNGYWYENLDLPGAGQMRYLKDLMLSVPFAELVPDQHLLVPHWSACRAIRTENGSTALIYVPDGILGPLRLDLTRLAGPLRASWFVPSTGQEVEIGTLAPATVELSKPGGPRRGTDRVLVLRSA